MKKIYKTIGEVAKELDLIDKKTGHLQTHTIRYWETQFKQIKPTIMAGRRRYYSDKNIKILDAGCGSGLTGIELKKRGYANIHGVDFSKSMLNLIPNNIYQTVELIDLNEPLKYDDNDFGAIICVGTFTYGHVKAHALDEFIRVTNKNGYICFTINEGIYTEYKFDKKINELSKNKSWEVLNLSKSSYIVNKDVEAWLCLAKKN